MASQINYGERFTAVTHLADWTRTDLYHQKYLMPLDESLEAALADSDAAGLPPINVPPSQGKFLHLLVKTFQAKRVLEVGTLGGYSTIWIAGGLPDDGEVISLEISRKFAEVAQKNIERDGQASKVKIILGDATATLADLPSEPKFDIAFIDADKNNSAKYYAEAKRLVRRGGIIYVDNISREGRVSDMSHNEGDVIGVRQLMEIMRNDSEVDATAVSTVGEKGYDGFMYVLVK